MFDRDESLYACIVYFKDESIRDFLTDYEEICDKVEEIADSNYDVSIWDDFVKKYSKSYFCNFINKSDLSKLVYRYKVQYNGLPVHLMSKFESNVFFFSCLYEDIEEKRLPVDSYTVLCVNIVLNDTDLQRLKNNPKDYTIVIDDAFCTKNDSMYLGITASYPPRYKGEINCYNAFAYLDVSKKDINLFDVEIEYLDFEDYNHFNHSGSYHFAYLRKNE